jgi:hypothetical protein
MMQAVKEPSHANGMQKVSEDALIGEMKGGRKPLLIAVGVGVVVIIAVIIALSV